MYSCKKCLKTFIKKYDLDRHLNRKTPCDNSFPQTKRIDSFMCTYCLQYFANEFNLERHLFNSPNSSCPFASASKTIILTVNSDSGNSETIISMTKQTF